MKSYVSTFFQPPVPAEPWEGIKDATAIHSDCPQRNIYTRSPKIEGQEDCLYLNVYTPNVRIIPKFLYFVYQNL